MPARPSLLVPLVALLAIALANGPSLDAQSSAGLFDGQTLHDLRIYVHSKDLAQLRARYAEDIYVPADLVWQNVRVRNVGVRSRGLASRNPTKLALHVSMNRYTPGQTFLGLRSIILDNFWQDPAMMREPLAMAMFTRMGQPAPRESIARLFINNQYEGLYAIVENVDTTFLGRTFGRSDGYLFEYEWWHVFPGDYPGGEYPIYRLMFPPRTHERETDEVLYEPIRALFDLANAPDETASRDDLEQYIDLAQFVTVAAIEKFMAEDDGLLGYAGMANFFLYRDRDSTRHSVVLWDRDRAFTLRDESPFERLEENALLRRALSYEDLYALYLDVLEATARMVSEDGWFEREVDRLAQLTAAAAHADGRKPYSNLDYEQAVAFMREFAAMRPGFVLAEVDAARRGAR